MMEFELNDEQRLLCDTVRGFGEQQIRPYAAQWDEARAGLEGLWLPLGAMGLLAMEVPESEGGAGLSTVAATALLQELAAADGGLAVMVAAHNHLGVGHATAGLDRALLADERSSLVSGERLVAWGLPSTAYAPEFEGQWEVQARRSAEGAGWVLDGEVRYVLGAGWAQRIVVFAAADEGPTAWWVNTDTPGLSVSEPVRTLGARTAGTAHLRLRGVRVEQERRLGTPGRAFADAQPLLARHQIATAAIACGVGREALNHSVRYAKEREQFGQPIANFQAIQWKLADMHTSLEAAWLMTQRAAWHRDEKRRDDGQEAARACGWATAAATKACSEALQIHGGYGYTGEYPIERALRNARFIQQWGGASAWSWVSRAIARRFGGP